MAVPSNESYECSLGLDVNCKLIHDQALPLTSLALDASVTNAARQRIGALQWSLARRRSFQVCVGLQSLELDTSALNADVWASGVSCGFTRAITTTVRHFRRHRN